MTVIHSTSSSPVKTYEKYRNICPTPTSSCSAMVGKGGGRGDRLADRRVAPRILQGYVRACVGTPSPKTVTILGHERQGMGCGLLPSWQAPRSTPASPSDKCAALRSGTGVLWEAPLGSACPACRPQSFL